MLSAPVAAAGAPAPYGHAPAAGAGAGAEPGAGGATQSAGVGAGAACGGAGVPFMVSVGWSGCRAATADRSYPHAPQKRSPDSSGSEQLGHSDTAACWGICDINYTHVRGR
ncbi:hypothetical protein GCM10020256_50860 [Streptomyces thermocoprophilus]